MSTPEPEVPATEQSTEQSAEQSTEPSTEQSAEQSAEQSTEPSTEQSAEPRPERGARAQWWGVAALLSIVVGWFVWDAVGSLVSLPQLYAQLGIADDEVPWVALWLGVVQPVSLYAAALAIAARQPLARAALVMVASLGAIAALRLSIIAVATGTITIVG
ncbi:MAG: hypothetical protein Q7J04_08925 [Microcella sp.]|nr:hypothetical protein [Microcella sp.]